MRVRSVTYEEELRELVAGFPRNEGAPAEDIELTSHFTAEAHFPEVMKASSGRSR